MEKKFLRLVLTDKYLKINTLGKRDPVSYCGRLVDYQNRKDGRREGRKERKEGKRTPLAALTQLGWSAATGQASPFLGTDHGARCQSRARQLW